MLTDEQRAFLVELQEELNTQDTFCQADPRFWVVAQGKKNRIAHGTMFLTIRECREHIKANDYHYKKPHPYAMTAFRSPQVEKLIKILRTVDWGDV